MKKICKILLCLTLMALLLCPFSALAFSAETKQEENPQIVLDSSISGVSDKEEKAEETTEDTEEYSLATRKLLYDKDTNKQFISVQTREGSIFYLVIDYDKPTDEKGEQFEALFLNAVDNADLTALVGEEEEEIPVCTCSDLCTAGHINMECPVCASNMGECTGKSPEPEPEEEEEEPKEKGGNASGIIAIVLLAALGGGGSFYYFKTKKKPDTRGSTDLDNYDFGLDEDSEEYELPPEEKEE